jgi:hypothetical protein
MNKTSFLNPQGAWDPDTPYAAIPITGAAAIGLNYVTLPLVTDKGSMWFTNGLSKPVEGTHPANDAGWTLLQAGTVFSASAPTSSNDKTQGYAVGTLWLDTANGDAFVCTANTATSAVWTAFAGNI